MEQEKKFYRYRQENPGGTFVYDTESGISGIMLVEATDARHANARMTAMGCGFEDSCPCCGYRWLESDDQELPGLFYGSSGYLTGEKVPAPYAPLEAESYEGKNFSVIYGRKMMQDGQWEGYVHPLDDDPYPFGLVRSAANKRAMKEHAQKKSRR